MPRRAKVVGQKYRPGKDLFDFRELTEHLKPYEAKPIGGKKQRRAPTRIRPEDAWAEFEQSTQEQGGD